MLADALPKFAKILTKVIAFIANNPLLAGGLAIGAKVGAGFAGPAASSLGSAAVGLVQASPS